MFGAGKGIGNVLSAPIASLLLHPWAGTGKTSFPYGTQGYVCVFLGAWILLTYFPGPFDFVYGLDVAEQHCWDLVSYSVDSLSPSLCGTICCLTQVADATPHSTYTGKPTTSKGIHVLLYITYYIVFYILRKKVFPIIRDPLSDEGAAHFRLLEHCSIIWVEFARCWRDDIDNKGLERW